jgi:hypothetical protein
MKRLALSLSLVFLFVFAFPNTVMAGGLYEGKVIMGSNFTLESGEEIDGDLLVFGGNVSLMTESRVRGDVVLFGGNINADGEITGDLAVLGGYVELKSEALIRGDLFLLGGDLQKADGAQILGDTMSENNFNIPYDFEWSGPDFNWPRYNAASALTKGLWYLFRSFMMAALAVLVVMFAPDATKRVGAAVVDQPLLAGGAGLLTAFVFPIAMVVMVVLILTILAIPLVVMVLIAAVVFGWIAIGLEVGERLGETLNWDLHPAAAAGLGTFLFSVVIWGIGFIDCIGWIAPAVMYCFALGGIILTRFGTQSYTFTPSRPARIEAEVEEIAEPEEVEEGGPEEEEE